MWCASLTAAMGYISRHLHRRIDRIGVGAEFFQRPDQIATPMKPDRLYGVGHRGHRARQKLRMIALHKSQQPVATTSSFFIRLLRELVACSS